MALQTVQYPLINGVQYDFSSVEFNVPGYPAAPPYGGILAVQSIDYTDNLEPGELRGAAPQVLARTRGKYEASGKLKLPKTDAQTLISVMNTAGSALTKPMGYLEYGGLTITTVYFEPTIPAYVTDTLIGFRMGKMADAHKTGQEVLMVDIDFKLLMLVRNGLYPYDPQNLMIAFPGGHL